MARGVLFSPIAWDEYLEWVNDHETFAKLNRLLSECQRDPMKGTGKPEILRHMKPYMSRRLTQKHRIIYGASAENVLVIRCKDHYDDK
ncbi:Toxin YoeB [Burkholderia latens]|uniref:Txe/YoeB family addiction module toxin n=1 Tax=Burkholderia latens TaxID=488446 RepID=UPI0039A618C9